MVLYTKLLLKIGERSKFIADPFVLMLFYLRSIRNGGLLVFLMLDQAGAGTESTLASHLLYSHEFTIVFMPLIRNLVYKELL